MVGFLCTLAGENDPERVSFDVRSRRHVIEYSNNNFDSSSRQELHVNDNYYSQIKRIHIFTWGEELRKTKMSLLFCPSCRSADFFGLLRRADTADTHIIRRFARLQSEVLIFDILQPGEETEEEDRPGEKVENAVEDHFAGHRDGIPTLGEAPANRVKNPDECGVARSNSVHRLVRKEA